MRSFIALDIPDSARQAIQKVVGEARTGTRGVKWAPVENVHLTLKFLGEVDAPRIPAIAEGLRQVVLAHKPFPLAIRGAGAFPNLRRPNVLWIGIDPSPELAALFESIDAAMAGLGFERETRRFSPHLTIARVKEGAGLANVSSVLTTYNAAFFGTIEVREILLMESVLKQSGSEYRRTAVAPLSTH
jgi:2'-5' RNA ligase